MRGKATLVGREVRLHKLVGHIEDFIFYTKCAVKSHNRYKHGNDPIGFRFAELSRFCVQSKLEREIMET